MKINEITIKNFKRESGIYYIKNLINNKIYIGQAKSIYNRLINHKCILLKGNHNNSHLQRAWNKYGKDNFEFGVLEYCLDLTEKEKYYISIQKECYNIRDACNSVIHPRRLSINEETRLKLRTSKLGKIPKNLFDIQQNNRKRIAYYIDDELINIFDSCKDAAEYFKMKKNVFHEYIGKNRKSKFFPENYKIVYYE